MKKITVFAHNGHVTALAFPNEATNYNGVAVATIEVADGESVADKLAEAGLGAGVGTRWPVVKSEAPKAVKPAKAK